jgi:transposase
LSIDEKCVGRGHKYISVLSDANTGKVIEITAGRSQDSADKLCSSLSFEQRSMVETVCTDMWHPYITVANKHFPNAKHCFDNFHLVGYLN